MFFEFALEDINKKHCIVLQVRNVKIKCRKYSKDIIEYSGTYDVFLGFPVFLKNILSQNMTGEAYHTSNNSGLCYRSVNFDRFFLV